MVCHAQGWKARLELRGGAATRDVIVTAVPGATVAQLLDALAAPAARGVLVDGTFVPRDRPLAHTGALDGSTIDVVRADGEAARSVATRSSLDVVGGLDAGRRLPVAVGTHVVGRDGALRLDAPTVSRRHAVLTVDACGRGAIADLGSRNGTSVGGRFVARRAAPLTADDPVRLGALDLRLRLARVDDRPLALRPAAGAGAASSLPFNRPPRPPLPPEAPVVAVPEAPRPPPPRQGLSVAALVLPLVMAALLVRLAGNPTFALFALLSPVLLVGSTIEQRRRGVRARRRDAAAHRAALGRLGTALADAAAGEAARRHAMLPDLAEVARRAALPSIRLWERRPGDADHLRLCVGCGDAPWLPPLDEPAARRDPALESVLVAHGTLAAVPIDVDLRDGGAVGVVGDRAAALAVARSLVLQAAVHHGPADLAIAVAAAPDAAGEWDWAKWLPHVRPAGVPALAGDGGEAAALGEALLAGGDSRGTTLVVVDGPQLLSGRRSPLRAVLQGRGGGPVAGIVIAASADGLPAMCTTVVDLRGPDGVATVRTARGDLDTTDVLAAGCAIDVARDVARHLARYEDPELDAAGAGLPDAVRLLDLLEPAGGAGDGGWPGWVAESWARADGVATTVVGVGADGAVDVDLDRDGPHALVAGTTGAGKSELLRTLVVGLATRLPPDQLTLLLIDFKGGAAFDACARLPHVVGVVTDLDEQLAERALRCLEAELRHRERALRASGAADLAAHRRTGLGPRLPRLVVVIDELATLRAEVPGFVDALVGVAQRGRSLGVHLILATQRPAGTVDDHIRANTTLRIALRVQDAGDSVDVVGVPAAATISRGRPGRGIIRFGPGDLVAVQAALATGTARDAERPAVVVAPFGPARAVADGREDAGATDLEVLVDACAAAFAASGAPAPRRPWPDPLPADIDAVDLPVAADEADDLVAYALADDPDGQRQLVHGWRPAQGNLLVWGIGGSGTSTTLAAIALALAQGRPPDRLHLYVLSHGAGELAPLARLPHCGAVVTGAEREREARLLRWLRAEVGRRRAVAAAGGEVGPTIVLLVDGYGSFAAGRADVAGLAVVDDLARTFAEGTEVAVHVVVAADRVGAVPVALTALAHQRLVLRLADPHDPGLAGVTARALPRFVPGRGIDVGSGHVVQVVRPRHGLRMAVDAVVAAAPAATVAPVAVGVLPMHVPVGDVAIAARVGARPWWLPIGMGERALAPAGFELHEGDHALVAGPARSGRSSALLAVAAAFRVGAPRGAVFVVAGARSPLSVLGTAHRPVDVGAAVAAVRAAAGPALLLVDDADLVEDPAGVLAALLTEPGGPFAVVAAGRAEALRTTYGHWTRQLRRSHVGLLLQPDTDLDGELLGQPLPRRAPVALPVGRGWLRSGGDLDVVQVAT